MACFVIQPCAKAILFGSGRRVLVTVGECYLSERKQAPPLLGPLSQCLIIAHVPGAPLRNEADCLLGRLVSCFPIVY